jgi:hypothetical protein
LNSSIHPPLDGLIFLQENEETGSAGFLKMNPPKRQQDPINRPVFWMRFVGGLIFFGAVLELIAVQLADILGMLHSMCLWAGFTVGFSAYV